MNRKPFVVGCVTLSLFVSSFLVAAPKPNNAKEEQQEREREQKAEQEVKAARAKADAAQKQLAAAANVGKQALSARDNAAKRIKELKDRLEEKYASRAGVTAAHDHQQAMKAALEKITEPLLAALKADANYQAALQTATAAKQEYAAGGVGDSRLQELKEQVLRPGQLERAALEANPQAKAAKDKMEEANKAVASAREKLTQLVEADPELQKALKELAEANKHLDDAKRKFAIEQRETAAANAAVTREIAQLNQIKNANRLDDIKDRQAQQQKNNKNKKGK